MNTNMGKEEVIQKLEEMSILFYQEKDSEGCDMFNQILPDLTEIITSEMDAEKQLRLLQSLQLALQALEAEEWIMLADIFQYEICDVLKG